MDEDSTEIDEQREALGIDVLKECQTELMMAFRFLDAALWHLPFKGNKLLYAFDTNGRAILFGPAALLERYVGAPQEVMRDYLHVLLHCIFRHPFDTEHDEFDAWSIACDIVVEGIALEMAGERWPSERDGERRRALAEVLSLTGTLNPYKIYRVIADALADPSQLNRKLPSWELIYTWGTLFFRDSHNLWAHPYDPSNEQDKKSASPDEDLDAKTLKGDSSDEEDAEQDDSGDTGSQDESGDETPDDFQSESDDDQDEDGLDEQDASQDEKSDEEREWEEISKSVEMALDKQLKSSGGEGGALLLNLTIANRPPVDYADFLRQFATPSEEIKINDDEFDYVFYTYGLSLYGNMPLVEPLEYQETNRIREFVIAIDTSGSTQGELVRTFVTRTCEILRESEEFGSEVNIHIIQCDARIQQDKKIESKEDLERYLDKLEVRGGGDTDFRPVFDYVDGLIDKGEFTNLRGLIYFTDGLGSYPTTMPRYETAFVFVDDDRSSRYVPPWAMKVVIDTESIQSL